MPNTQDKESTIVSFAVVELSEESIAVKPWTEAAGTMKGNNERVDESFLKRLYQQDTNVNGVRQASEPFSVAQLTAPKLTKNEIERALGIVNNLRQSYK